MICAADKIRESGAPPGNAEILNRRLCKQFKVCHFRVFCRPIINYSIRIGGPPDVCIFSYFQNERIFTSNMTNFLIEYFQKSVSAYSRRFEHAFCRRHPSVHSRKRFVCYRNLITSGLLRRIRIVTFYRSISTVHTLYFVDWLSIWMNGATFLNLYLDEQLHGLYFYTLILEDI
jgi:hypothetical protein